METKEKGTALPNLGFKLTRQMWGFFSSRFVL